jgi:hypothetical protein
MNRKKIDPKRILSGINYFKEKGFISENDANLLKEAQLTTIYDYRNPEWLIDVFECLNKSNMLKADNLKIICEHIDPCNMTSALITLEEAGLSTQANRETLIKHDDPLEIASVLVRCNKNKILGLVTQDSILEQQNTLQVVDACQRIQEGDLLTPDNQKIISEHERPLDMASALIKLENAGIYTLKNIQALLNNPTIFVSINLNRDLTNNKAFYHKHVFDILPPELITQEVFDNLILTCNDVKALNNYLVELVSREHSTDAPKAHSTVANTDNELSNKIIEKIASNPGNLDIGKTNAPKELLTVDLFQII